MTCLYELQTLEFYCSHQTASEREQLSLWVKKEMRKKIDSLQITPRNRRFMMFICTKVDANIREIFSKEATANFFVVFYARLLNLCQSDVEKPNDKEITARTRERLVRQMRVRDEKRVAFLQKHMSEAKLSDFNSWLEQNAEADGAMFNLIVDAFVEQLTMKMLEKSVCKMLFPKTRDFTEN